MKYVVQLIEATTGKRSEPFGISTADLFNLLTENENIQPEDFILCVGHVTEEEEQLELMNTPLITVKSFLAVKDPSLHLEDAENYQEEAQNG